MCVYIYDNMTLSVVKVKSVSALWHKWRLSHIRHQWQNNMVQVKVVTWPVSALVKIYSVDAKDTILVIHLCTYVLSLAYSFGLLLCLWPDVCLSATQDNRLYIHRKQKTVETQNSKRRHPSFLCDISSNSSVCERKTKLVCVCLLAFAFPCHSTGRQTDRQTEYNLACVHVSMQTQHRTGIVVS